MSVTVWIGVALFILGNALYVSAEFGAVGARRSRIRRLSDDGNAFARRLLPYVESPTSLVRYLSASQIGITLSSLMLGAFAQATFTVALAPILQDVMRLEPVTAASTAAIIVLLLLSCAQVVLGELVPKSIALQYPTETALFTVVPMQWSLVIFRPFAALLNGAAGVVLRMVGTQGSSHRHVHSPDEIELLIAESRDGGLLEPEEQQRLHRALRLGLRSARDLMVPLDKLTMVERNLSWEQLVQAVARSPFSRLPVYEGARAHIVGVLRVKDLVERFVVEGPVPLDRLILPVVYLSADLAADRVLSLLRERRIHQAVVMDAQSAAIGLVTIQDVLSELMGSRGAGR